ncbi:MAG TPA: ATPase, T2SS/T4P/T4SS family [Rhodanobacteraceae bacterium]|nr:ATPase, T2SS/T4P/T4SS family [Rhodanobacteraceae bacterium]
MSHQIKILKFEDRHKIRDIYIPLEVSEGRDGFEVSEAGLADAYCYTGKPEARLVFDPNDGQMMNWFLQLYSASQAAAQKRHNFRLEHDGVMFRAKRTLTVNGWELALRALPKDAPNLGQLAMPHAWRELMMDPDLLAGGLVLITATNGQGKTTHASAAVVSRLLRYAGFGVTVEDPPELNLQQWIGEGRCNQIPVDTPPGAQPGSGFAEALIGARRYFPAMTGGGTVLFIGEIRNAETAAETLLAANEGHLVIATFHASSIQNALMRLISMASDKLGKEQAREALAATLKMCIYQRLLLKDEGTMWERGQYIGDLLWSPGAESQVGEELLNFDMKSVMKRVQAQSVALGRFSEGARPRLADLRDALRNAKSGA